MDQPIAKKRFGGSGIKLFSKSSESDSSKNKEEKKLDKKAKKVQAVHPIAKKKNSNEHPIVKKKISDELKKEKLPIDVDPFPEVSTKDKAQKPTKLDLKTGSFITPPVAGSEDKDRMLKKKKSFSPKASPTTESKPGIARTGSLKRTTTAIKARLFGGETTPPESPSPPQKPSRKTLTVPTTGASSIDFVTDDGFVFVQDPKEGIFKRGVKFTFFLYFFATSWFVSTE